jgi:integrase
MSSVQKRPDGRYRVRWRDPQGKERAKHFTRKIDADRFRSTVDADVIRGTYVDPVAGRRTFRDYAEQWRAMQPHRPNTAARTKSQLHKHVYPAFGDRPLVQIRASELQAFVTGLPLAPSSVRPVWATVRAILSAALHDRLIGQDPSERIKLPELPRNEIVPLTLDQVERLTAAMPARYRALVIADAASGLRQGEIFGLQVPDVNFLRRTMKLDRQVQPAVGGGTVVCPLKNKYSYRTIPVGRVVTDALAAHLAAYPAGPDGFVFTDEDGQPLHRNRFNEQIWAPAREAAGLPEVTQHDLRHFYASALIRAGLNAKVVAERLGHADPAMTWRVYAHLWPDDEDRSRQAIDDVFDRKINQRADRMRTADGS